MKTRTLFLPFLAFCVLSCADKDTDAAESLMTEIRSDFDAGRDSACLAGIDTLRARYPKAIEQRKEALELYQKASERIAQKDLEKTNQLLDEANAIYEKQKQVVETHKASLTASPEELTALTLMRMKRDSLQTRFEVLCGQIRFIHKKQKEK